MLCHNYRLPPLPKMWPVLCAIYTSGGPPRLSFVTSVVPMCYSRPLPNGWRAKVSDYGSANFMNAVATAAPGSPVYAAPEARYPDQHSPKMDTFSYGVLLVEIMCSKSSLSLVQHRERLRSCKSSGQPWCPW